MIGNTTRRAAGKEGGGAGVVSENKGQPEGVGTRHDKQTRREDARKTMEEGIKGKREGSVSFKVTRVEQVRTVETQRRSEESP